MSQPSRPWPKRYVDRLRRRLEMAEGPLIPLRAWPGAGRRLVLRELAREAAHQVPPAVLTNGPALARSLEEARAAGARFLLCRRPPRSVSPQALDHLPLGLPLLLPVPQDALATGSLAGAGNEGEAVHPAEWLLNAAEVGDLWRAVVEESLDPSAAEAWRAATDGWYLPLRLIAEARRVAREAGEPGPSPDPTALARLPALDAFLGEEVVAPLSGALTGQLDAAGGPSLEDPVWRGFRLLDRDSAEARLPVLLQAWLGEVRSSYRVEAVAVPTEPGPALVSARERVADASAPLYQVFLFGDARVLLSPPEGEPREVSWTLNRGLSLFAYLASTPGRRAGKEELTEALFTGEGSEAIRRNFHPTLSYLRRDLGGGQDSSLKPVVYRSGGYELNPDYRWSIDLDAFEAHRQAGIERRRAGDLAGAGEHLAASWGHYRGVFLQGVYDPWAARRREELYRAYLTLLRNLGEVRWELEDLERALDAYRAVLIEDPLEEAVQTEVMRIYAAQGRRDLVRRQYDRLSVLLLDELGVEPLPETTAVYHRLMA